MNKYLFQLFLLSVIISPACLSQSGSIIRTGADRTEAYLPLLEGYKVGVVANHTSMIGRTHLVDSLLSLGVDIVRIFSPEHGFRGHAGAGVMIDDGIDELTSLPVVSLYGNHKKPLPAELEDLDIVLFDIQDVGARFYTYISTLQFVMEALADEDMPLLLLDRPNPNAHYTDGPVLDTAYRSFVGMQPIPVVYGMTIGEYACMLSGEKWLNTQGNCNLTVIECLNYDHGKEYILPVGPSPNLPTQNSVYLYPSLCFFEGTVYSCGRGTDAPFELYGHPLYADHDFSFIPVQSEGVPLPRLAGKECYGKDLRKYTGSEAGVKGMINPGWIIDAYNKFSGEESFFNSYFDLLAGSSKLREQIEDGYTAEEIRSSWEDDLTTFRQIREKYLLY